MVLVIPCLLMTPIENRSADVNAAVNGAAKIIFIPLPDPVLKTDDQHRERKKIMQKNYAAAVPSLSAKLDFTQA